MRKRAGKRASAIYKQRSRERQVAQAPYIALTRFRVRPTEFKRDCSQSNRESRTFKWELARVCVLGAGQQKYGLWGRLHDLLTTIYIMKNINLVSRAHISFGKHQERGLWLSPIYVCDSRTSVRIMAKPNLASCALRVSLHCTSPRSTRDEHNNYIYTQKLTTLRWVKCDNSTKQYPASTRGYSRNSSRQRLGAIRTCVVT